MRKSLFPFLGSFKCQCRENYKLRDQYSCKPIDPSNYPQGELLFSDRYDIRRLSLDRKNYHTVVSELINVVAVDYDWREQRIFWSTNSPKGIKSAKMDGTDIKTIIRLTRSSPDGMAVDWVGRNLYFCEALDGAIFVSRLNGFMLKKLITGLHEPRGMAVYPEEGEERLGILKDQLGVVHMYNLGSLLIEVECCYSRL